MAVGAGLCPSSRFPLQEIPLRRETGLPPLPVPISITDSYNHLRTLLSVGQIGQCLDVPCWPRGGRSSDPFVFLRRVFRQERACASSGIAKAGPSLMEKEKCLLSARPPKFIM